MKNKYLYLIWAGMYVLCAALGCIGASAGWLYALCVAAAVLFFVPPAVLLHRAKAAGDRRTLRRLVTVSAVWLITTPILIICNFFSVGATEQAGRILYYLLAVITSPMVCGRIWVISIFLWACLLMASLQALRKKS